MPSDVTKCHYLTYTCAGNEDINVAHSDGDNSDSDDSDHENWDIPLTKLRARFV